MIHSTGQDWLDAPEKRVMLFGMSGLGKTHVASMLRASGTWFHYSVDYRIGTRYMGELIADDFKRHAMQVPLLRELLMSDSVRIESNITFHNLAPLSTYLGKPGDPARGGLAFPDYMARQDQHLAHRLGGGRRRADSERAAAPCGERGDGGRQDGDSHHDGHRQAPSTCEAQRRRLSR